MNKTNNPHNSTHCNETAEHQRHFKKQPERKDKGATDREWASCNQQERPEENGIMSSKC